MKNFKLLLATTAILSAGLVMGVMAETADTVNISIHARVVSASGGTLIQNIDFGNLIKYEGTVVDKVSMDPKTGVVTYINGSTNVHTLEEPREPGILTFTYDWSAGVIGSATVPESVSLTHSMGWNDGGVFYPVIEKIDGITQDGDDAVETYHIGGYIANLHNLSTGEYNASFTVTLLLEEE